MRTSTHSHRRGAAGSCASENEKLTYYVGRGMLRSKDHLLGEAEHKVLVKGDVIAAAQVHVCNLQRCGDLQNKIQNFAPFL